MSQVIMTTASTFGLGNPLRLQIRVIGVLGVEIHLEQPKDLIIPPDKR